MRCKHNYGWLVIDSQTVFTDEKGTLRMGFSGNINKLLARCNYPKCDKVRNLYLTGKVKKYGKIRGRASK